jgi:hypothetical protein
MIHRFNYPAFRRAFLRAKAEQHARALVEDKLYAVKTAHTRPTEFTIEVRLRLARSRLTLTPLEKRVLHYDKQYLRTHDGDDVRSDLITRERIDYIGARAGCSRQQVARVLEQLEWMSWAAEVLEVELETDLVRCARRRVRVGVKV